MPSSADEGVVLLHDLGGVKISNLRIFTPARIRMIVDFYKVRANYVHKYVYFAKFERDGIQGGKWDGFLEKIKYFRNLSVRSGAWLQ